MLLRLPTARHAIPAKTPSHGHVFRLEFCLLGFALHAFLRLSRLEWQSRMPPKHVPQFARQIPESSSGGKLWDCRAFNPKLERRQLDGKPLIYIPEEWWPKPELRSEKQLGWKQLPLCRSCWCIDGTGHAPLCQAVYPRYTGQGRSTASKPMSCSSGHQ